MSSAKWRVVYLGLNVLREPMTIFLCVHRKHITPSTGSTYALCRHVVRVMGNDQLWCIIMVEVSMLDRWVSETGQVSWEIFQALWLVVLAVFGALDQSHALYVGPLLANIFWISWCVSSIKLRIFFFVLWIYTDSNHCYSLPTKHLCSFHIYFNCEIIFSWIKHRLCSDLPHPSPPYPTPPPPRRDASHAVVMRLGTSIYSVAEYNNDVPKIPFDSTDEEYDKT